MMLGEATLTLPDERSFTLRLSNLALFKAEGFYGKPIEDVLADMRAGFGSATAAVFRAGLLKHHPTLANDEEAVADILMENIADVMAALTLALARSLPDADKGEVGNAPRPQAGKTSGGAGAKPGSTRKASGKKRRAATT